MRQSNWRRLEATGLPWSEMKHMVVRRRATSAETSRGGAITDWTIIDPQSIAGLLQPTTGLISNGPEGMRQESTHVFYCNRTLTADDDTPIDVQTGDRFIDASGAQYRVIFAENAAGQYYIVPPNTDTTDSGDPSIPLPSAGNGIGAQVSGDGHFEILLKVLLPGGD